MTTERTISVSRGDAGSMDLFTWNPDQPIGSVLLLQEIFGVGAYIRAVAQRLADAGWVVAAPDLFWRFAPGWQAGHDQAGLEASFGKVGQLDVPLAIADSVAAFDALAAVAEVAGLKTPAVLGFCLGGTLAFGVAASATPSATVSYYGSGVRSMLGLMSQITTPVLFHFGDADGYIPGDDIDAVAASMAGTSLFTINVEHAGHAFDNHESEMFWNESAAKAAWTKTMSFLQLHAAR
jgi:carboxymethylenebutenolidase